MTTLPDPERIKELREKLRVWRDHRDPSDLAMGRVYADLLAILDALPGLQVEVERLRDQCEMSGRVNLTASRQIAELKARAEKAEATLVFTQERAQKAEAELEAARPLINAVMKWDLEMLDCDSDGEERILSKARSYRKNLAYRKEKEGKG